MTGLNASCLLRGALGEGMLILSDKSSSSVHVGKENAERCGTAGLQLYGDPVKHARYMDAFRRHVDAARQTIVKKYQTALPAVNKQEAAADLMFIAQLWDFYGKAESFYVEGAYQSAAEWEDMAMLERLEETSAYKFIARGLMNDYFFDGGVMDNLCRSLAAQFGYEHVDVLHTEEVLALFDGTFVSSDIAQKRREAHAVACRDGAMRIFSYEESQQLRDVFRSRVDDTVRGQVANQGSAIGRAFVIPMIKDHDDVVRADREMSKGDVLVAETTSPEILGLCRKASAIVTSVGGMLSHAAIVSRELKVPCIVGAGNALSAIKTGDHIEVDGDDGVIRIVKRAPERRP